MAVPRQVFGLMGGLLIATSQPLPRGQCILRRSFPITAAGQSRIRTGFPFQRPREGAYLGRFELSRSLLDLTRANLAGRDFRQLQPQHGAARRAHQAAAVQHVHRRRFALRAGDRRICRSGQGSWRRHTSHRPSRGRARRFKGCVAACANVVETARRRAAIRDLHRAALRARDGELASCAHPLTAPPCLPRSNTRDMLTPGAFTNTHRSRRIPEAAEDRLPPKYIFANAARADSSFPRACSSGHL